jgi:FkbM family methyltransferase
MHLLRSAARAVAGAIGRDRWIIRALRPAYDWTLHLTTAGRGIVQTLNGRERFRIDPRHRRHFPEVYDPTVFDYLRTRLGEGSVCLNVGAHVGIYTLCLAEWTGPRGRVVAFEPNPISREILTRHVALNGFTDRVEVRPEAVAGTPGRVAFIVSGSEGISRLLRPNPSQPGGSSIEVDATTIDAFCARRRLAPDWIVMDVEGYEVAALEGARETVTARRDGLGIVVELHPDVWEISGASRSKMEKLLTELRLAVVPLTGQSAPLEQHGIVSLEKL